ncbi:Serine palmitoyltransferase 2 [Hordeum vulgare]|nr:Serine palmitoyltransferase 2 [Hordeum vulgare]
MVRLPYLTALTTPFSYGLLFPFGHFRDFFRRILDADKSNNLKGYAPICLGYEDFYRRRLYLRIQALQSIYLLQQTVVNRVLKEKYMT